MPSDASYFDGKRYVVTGAANGIGHACVERLLEAGAKVLGIDLAPSVSTTFDTPLYSGVVANVTDKKRIASTVAEFAGDGSIDGVVSNAGVFISGQNIADLDMQDWQKSIAVNLTSHLIMLQSTIPLLTDGRGAIVVVGSRNVLAPGAGAAAYSCAKAGATQLARVAALELGARGIRVNVVHPDAVFDTALWTQEKLKSSARRYGMTVEEYKSQNLLKTEVGQANVAEAICALLGSAFAKTTGAQIPVDGGNMRVV
ncbi:MAG: SDR family oxidoreductase [Microbacteriaceae bacterium]|nr:MAG: SDR family oxidoreductase [Microbacteriaceae bacterium]